MAPMPIFFDHRFPCGFFLLAAIASAASGCFGSGSLQNHLGPDGGGGTGGYLPVMSNGAGGVSSSAGPDATAADGSDGATAVDASGGPMDGVLPPTGDAAAFETSTPNDPTDAGANGTRSYEAESGALFGKAARVACATCSGGQRVSLQADSGFTLDGIDAGGAGAHILVVYYTNGDSVPRSIYIGVNGGASQVFPRLFPPTGAWNKVSAVGLPLSGFRAGTNNQVTFFIDSEQPAPDIDRIEIGPTQNTVTAQSIRVRTRIRSPQPPAGASWNGYDTVTRPPPSGAGYSHRFVASMTHDSTAGSPSVELCSADTSTLPVGAIVNCATTRPASVGLRASACS